MATTTATAFSLSIVEREARLFTNMETGKMTSKVCEPIVHVAYMENEALCEYTAYFLGWKYETRTNQHGFIQWEGWTSPAGKTRLQGCKDNGIPAPRYTTSKVGEVLAACALLGWEPKIFTRESEGKNLFALDLKPLPDGRALLRENIGQAICAGFLVAAWTVQDQTSPPEAVEVTEQPAQEVAP